MRLTAPSRCLQVGFVIIFNGAQNCICALAQILLNPYRGAFQLKVIRVIQDGKNHSLFVLTKQVFTLFRYNTLISHSIKYKRLKSDFCLVCGVKFHVAGYVEKFF